MPGRADLFAALDGNLGDAAFVTAALELGSEVGLDELHRFVVGDEACPAER